MVNESVDAGGVFADSFLGVEVWHAFAADGSSEDILMSVDKGVYALLTELGDKLVDLGEVSEVKLTAGALNGLPHDTESDKVHAPLGKVINILVIQGELGIETFFGRNVGSHLVDNVDTVEDDGTAVLIDKLARLRVHRDPGESGVNEGCSGNTCDHFEC